MLSKKDSFILFFTIYYVWFQVSSFRCGLNCVEQKPAAQEIPNLRNDNSSQVRGGILYLCKSGLLNM